MSLAAFSDDVLTAIKAHLAANWSATPIFWPNEWPELAGVDAWILVELTRSIYGQESLGAETQAANRWDEEGNLWLHLNVPNGTGTTQAGGAARALADVFRGVTLLDGRLEFGDASIGQGGPGDGEGIWWTLSTSLEWRLVDA